VADVRKTAEVIITGDVSSANAAMRQAGAGLTAMGTAAAAAFGYAAKQAMDFETRMAEVSTVVDTSKVNMAGLTGEVERQALIYGKSANEMARAEYELLSAGVQAAESQEYLGVAARGAVGGLTDTKTSVDLLTTSVNAWGEASGGAAHVSDVAFQAVMLGKTRYEELAHSIGMVASQSATMNVSMEETYGALATMTLRGLDTGRATDYLRGAMTAILKPTDEAAKAAEAIGIKFDAATLASMGLEEFLRYVWDATGRDAEVMGQLFTSVEGLNGVLALVGQDGGAKFAEIMVQMENAAGAADTAYEKMADTAEVRYGQVKEQVASAWRSVGEAVLPVAEEIGDVVEIVAGQLDRLAESEAGKALIGLGSAGSVAFAGLGGTMLVLPRVVEGIEAADVALKALKSAIASPWQAGGLSIAGAVTATVGTLVIAEALAIWIEKQTTKQAEAAAAVGGAKPGYMPGGKRIETEEDWVRAYEEGRRTRIIPEPGRMGAREEVEWARRRREALERGELAPEMRPSVMTPGAEARAVEARVREYKAYREWRDQQEQVRSMHEKVAADRAAAAAAASSAVGPQVGSGTEGTGAEARAAGMAFEEEYGRLADEASWREAMREGGEEVAQAYLEHTRARVEAEIQSSHEAVARAAGNDEELKKAQQEALNAELSGARDIVAAEQAVRNGRRSDLEKQDRANKERQKEQDRANKERQKELERAARDQEALQRLMDKAEEQALSAELNAAKDRERRVEEMHRLFVQGAEDEARRRKAILDLRDDALAAQEEAAKAALKAAEDELDRARGSFGGSYSEQYVSGREAAWWDETRKSGLWGAQQWLAHQREQAQKQMAEAQRRFAAARPEERGGAWREVLRAQSEGARMVLGAEEDVSEAYRKALEDEAKAVGEQGQGRTTALQEQAAAWDQFLAEEYRRQQGLAQAQGEQWQQWAQVAEERVDVVSGWRDNIERERAIIALEEEAIQTRLQAVKEDIAYQQQRLAAQREVANPEAQLRDLRATHANEELQREAEGLAGPGGTPVLRGAAGLRERAEEGAVTQQIAAGARARGRWRGSGSMDVPGYGRGELWEIGQQNGQVVVPEKVGGVYVSAAELQEALRRQAAAPWDRSIGVQFRPQEWSGITPEGIGPPGMPRLIVVRHEVRNADGALVEAAARGLMQTRAAQDGVREVILEDVNRGTWDSRPGVW
jgi:TP901 family phage tail tape measure protein